ncbi:epidermal growth factor receptor substrate 15 isoform X2 [Monodelphis domestica]|uniref:epidermal growth factor receptor substrate 15 isoform X2 n=1 Tax=Monodelphis domestica TaxID=13616 RepID=UPI0024E25178|nr:epidermal growth factor receptor substrate 15 isoform X2 [Monodelphis domestica]
MAAAAQLSLTQLSSGNPVYEKFYRQVDSNNVGRVLAPDAAAFLKKSGLPDLILGKIWDLADTDGKGVLNKQEFFVALRLVACAQNGLEVSLSSLHLAVPPPRFRDSSSPLLLSGPASPELPWAVKTEEKAKYDAIFDSLSPVDGFLSGEKVKPVLLNSKLPVDILGRVWELSDIDHDGMLDRDEFAVAMFLVYCALEKEPVPMSLPPALVPPSKRKAVSTPTSRRSMPSAAPAKDSRRNSSPVGVLPSRALSQWVVSPAEKAKYDEIFLKTDKDMDGFVSGFEVREIFLKTGLPSSLLAHIWALCDTKDCGKLSKEQFALAFHFINQKLIKGIDPPQLLSAEMIPPSDRASLQKRSPAADFSAIKELDSLNNEIMDLQREKSSVEQDLQEKEDHIRHRTSEVQDLQDEVKRESSNLQKLHAQKQEVQDLLSGLDEQKAALEEQLSDVRQQCAEEAHLISSLKAELTSQESQISTYEEELSKARAELSRLQRETAELEESVEAGKAQLAPLQQHLHQSQQELTSMQVRLTEMKELDASSSQENWLRGSHSLLVNGAAEYCSLSNSSSETANLHEHLDTPTALETEPGPQESPVRSSPEVPSSEVADEKEGATHSVLEKEDFFSIDSSSLSDTAVESNLDFFQSDPFVGRDPFKDDPFGKIDPFGGDPFKGSDPFAADCFFKPSVTDLFAAPELDPFSAASSSSDLMMETLKDNDPFAPGGTVVAAASDPAVDPFTSVFGSDSCEVGFADFSSLAQDNSEEAFISTTSSSGDSVTLTPGAFEEPPPVKDEEVPPALPPKTGTPTRPCPPPPGNDTPTETALDLYRGPQHTSASATVAHTEAAPSRGANVGAYPTEEDLIEWAKRESEREEKERLARLNQQEQEDLELAIALSKSEISEA